MRRQNTNYSPDFIQENPPMPANASARTESTEADCRSDERQQEYEAMLEQLDTAAEQCLWKINGGGRITDAKKEQARAKWVNSLVRVVKERRNILEARELEQLHEEIEQLKVNRERERDAGGGAR